MRKLLMMTMCLIAVLAIARARANAAIQVNDKSPIFLTFFVPCALNGAGEVIDLSGYLHTVISYTINGNNVSGLSHFQPQGVSGTGETSGLKYQGTGVTANTFKGSFQNGQANFTFVNNFRIVGQGPGNNYLVHETLHYTFNANGLQTVYHDNLSVECK